MIVLHQINDLTRRERATLAQLIYEYCKFLSSYKMLASKYAPTVAMYPMTSSITSFAGLIRRTGTVGFMEQTNGRNPGTQLF